MGPKKRKVESKDGEEGVETVEVDVEKRKSPKGRIKPSVSPRLIKEVGQNNNTPQGLDHSYAMKEQEASSLPSKCPLWSDPRKQNEEQNQRDQDVKEEEDEEYKEYYEEHYEEEEKEEKSEEDKAEENVEEDDDEVEDKLMMAMTLEVERMKALRVERMKLRLWAAMEEEDSDSDLDSDEYEERFEDRMMMSYIKELQALNDEGDEENLGGRVSYEERMREFMGDYGEDELS